MSKINNTDIDNAQDIKIVVAMYNMIEYNNNYSKTSGSLWQYYKDDPNDNITRSESFKSKIKITGKTPADKNMKNVEILVPFKHLLILGELLKCHWSIVKLILFWHRQ